MTSYRTYLRLIIPLEETVGLGNGGPFPGSSVEANLLDLIIGKVEVYGTVNGGHGDETGGLQHLPGGCGEHANGCARLEAIMEIARSLVLLVDRHTGELIESVAVLDGDGCGGKQGELIEVGSTNDRSLIGRRSGLGFSREHDQFKALTRTEGDLTTDEEIT